MESVAGRGDAHERRGKRRARDPRASERASEASASATFLPLVSVPVPIVRHSYRLPEDETGVQRSRASPPLFFFYFLLVPLVYVHAFRTER